MKSFSHCPFYYCVMKTQAQNRLRQIYLLMKIAKRFEVKYSYLFLMSPAQDPFAMLTLQYGRRGNYNDIVDRLLSEGTFKRDNEASMPPFRQHCPRLCVSAFLENKRQESSRALYAVERSKFLGHCQEACLSCSRPSAALAGFSARLNCRLEVGWVQSTGSFHMFPLAGTTQSSYGGTNCIAMQMPLPAVMAAS